MTSVVGGFTDIDTKQKKKAATRDGRQPFVVLGVLEISVKCLHQMSVIVVLFLYGNLPVLPDFFLLPTPRKPHGKCHHPKKSFT